MEMWRPKLEAVLRKNYEIGRLVCPALYTESYADRYVEGQIQAALEREFSPARVAEKCIPLNHLKATAPDVYVNCDCVAVAPIAVLLRAKDLFKLAIGRAAIDQFVQIYNGAPDVDASSLYSAAMVDENIVCVEHKHSQNVMTLRGFFGIWLVPPSQELIDANNELLEMMAVLRAVNTALPQPIAEEIHAYFY